MKMKKWTAFLMAMVLCCLCACAFADNNRVVEAQNSVVRIYTKVLATCSGLNLNYDYIAGYTGSGIALGKGNEPVDTFLTNTHVVTFSEDEQAEWAINYAVDALSTQTSYLMASDAEKVEMIRDLASDILSATQFSVEVYVVLDGKNDMLRCFKVRAYQTDQEQGRDIAIIGAERATTKKKAATFAPLGQLKQTDTVHVIGYPGASDQVIDQQSLDSTKCTVTSGAVSRINIGHDGTNVVQHSAPMSGGNSGGALVDDRGYVVGMNTFTAVNGENANYAIAEDELIRAMNEYNATYQLASVTPVWLIVLIVVLALALIAGVTLLIVHKNRKPVARQATVPVPAPAPVQQSHQLVCVQGNSKGLTVPLTMGSIVIGRDAKQCRVVIDDNGVSRKHCTIRFNGSVVTVTDEGSSYGTMVHGGKLQPQMPMMVSWGEPICLGSEKCVFVVR